MKQEKNIVKILGEKIAIKFNLAVECNYEKIAEKPFDVNNLKSQTDSVALYMAAIIEANPDTEITVERLMREATGPEIQQLAKAVVSAMIAWLGTPKVMDKLQPAADDDKAEKKGKN